MDSAELLDLLGNANRRRILRLLARKPCYVTEISEYLGVSPKAVIDHLGKLEEAGLVKSRVDQKRRKYFSISRALRLEVSVSPYDFGTKSAYPASSGLDMTRWRYLSIEVGRDGGDKTDGSDDDGELSEAEGLSEMARKLRRLERLEDELSMAQRWAQGRVTDLRERIAEAVEEGDPRLVTAVLRALADEPGDTEAVSRRVEAPPRVVEQVLAELAEQEVVIEDSEGWRLPE
ncbi:MAG: ArsR family transcriptional regulator [Salinirussus sp.]|jgi:ArsR family transcriptional regulator